MSMPLSNTLQANFLDNHFLHHPKVDSELTRKYERVRLDRKISIFCLLLVAITVISDGKSIIKIRKPDLRKDPGHLIM